MEILWHSGIKSNSNKIHQWCQQVIFSCPIIVSYRRCFTIWVRNAKSNQTVEYIIVFKCITFIAISPEVQNALSNLSLAKLVRKSTKWWTTLSIWWNLQWFASPNRIHIKPNVFFFFLWQNMHTFAGNLNHQSPYLIA